MTNELTRFFVCWGSGSCNDGSCTGNNLEVFFTIEEAEQRLKKIKEDSRYDGTATIIEGETVWQENW